jgi:hypothetical protein
MMRRLDRLRRLLLAAVIIAGIPSCGKSSPSDSYKRTGIENFPTQTASHGSTDLKSPSVEYVRQNQKETPSWLDAAREDPDPRVRLHAIETWAIKPGKTLDPVTYALVDPDETVRARAQELFEEALERR